MAETGRFSQGGAVTPAVLWDELGASKAPVPRAFGSARGGRGWPLMGTAFLCADRQVLDEVVAGAAPLRDSAEGHWTVHFKVVNFMLCEFSLDLFSKASKKARKELFEVTCEKPGRSCASRRAPLQARAFRRGGCVSHVSQAGGRSDTWKEAFLSSALYFKHHKMPPGTLVGTNTPCSSFFFRTEMPLCSLPCKSQVIFLFLVETLSGTKDSITKGLGDNPEGRTRAVVAGLVVLGVAVVAAATGWMCRSRCPRHGAYTGTGRCAQVGGWAAFAWWE